MADAGLRYLATYRDVNATRHIWLLVQPEDCRFDGLWWPQDEALEIRSDGSWISKPARLGREGDQDVGKSFTIGLFVAAQATGAEVKAMANRDEPMKLPVGCKALHSIEVTRVS
jgi:hypothetical protein